LRFFFPSVAGYRESAFAYAISAAGVAHSVARACSQGRLISCGCDPSVHRRSMTKSLRESLAREKQKFLTSMSENENMLDNNIKPLPKNLKPRPSSRWKWGGCSHNMAFGVEFSELFLDSREKAGDIQSQINLHNNHAGRMAVANNMQVRCKCHGMSGSCQLKTCWKSAPDFRVVGKALKQQFKRAILVDQSNFGNGSPMVMYKKSKKKNGKLRVNRMPRRSENKDVYVRDNRKMENSLFYYQRSPNFCERDQISDIPGNSNWHLLYRFSV
jgi:wingless-type MMTV integration site family protein 10